MSVDLFFFLEMKALYFLIKELMLFPYKFVRKYSIIKHDISDKTKINMFFLG